MAVAVLVTVETRTATGNRRYTSNSVDLEEFRKVVKNIDSFRMTGVKLPPDGDL